MLSVSGEYGIINQIEFQGRSFAGESVAEYHVVETNDIVYTKSPLKANPYGIIKVNNGAPGIVSTLYAVYHPCEGTVAEYIDYYFGNDLRLNKYLKPLVNIGAKHDMKVNNETVLTGEVYFPGYSEQKKIVGFLTILDERIRQQRNLVEALKKYKRGLLRAIFSEKCEFFLLTDATTLRIGEVCDVLSGKRIPKGETFCPYPTNHRYITVSDMGEKYVCLDSLQYITAHTEKQISRYKVKKGDIIISVAGTLGKLNIITSDLEGVNLTENCDRFTNFRGIISEYLYYILSSDLIQSQIEASKTKNGQPKLALERIRNFTIPIPQQAKQKQLVNVMTSIDQLITSQITILDRYCKVRVGLLQQLFI